MNRFEKIDLTDVERISSDKDSDKNPKYRITYEPLADGDSEALESLIKALAEKDLLEGETKTPLKQQSLDGYED